MITLGIDLAGCMSGNSAYVLVDWSTTNPTILEAYKEPKHTEHLSCADYLQQILSTTPAQAIGIDAPFSLPNALLDGVSDDDQRVGKGEIINPYLYRYTDYWLYHTYGLRPMPPAGDRIGRLTARMVQLLQTFTYTMPMLQLPQGEIPAYEVYPKQIAHSLGIKAYKKNPQELNAYFGIELPKDEHLLDAFLAAYASWQITLGNTIHPPEHTKEEGWCYPLHLKSD